MTTIAARAQSAVQMRAEKYAGPRNIIVSNFSILFLGRVSQELNYEEDDYLNGMEENLLMYDTGPDYYMGEDEIPPEFRPDSRSGFFDSQGPAFYQQNYEQPAHHYY